MPRIVFETAAGPTIEVEARVGESVMLAALVGSVPGIEAECGGACSCGTCHVHVDAAWRDAAGPPNALEAGMLEMIDGAGASSRLCCQIKVLDELDGLVVRVPA